MSSPSAALLPASLTLSCSPPLRPWLFLFPSGLCLRLRSRFRWLRAAEGSRPRLSDRLRVNPRLLEITSILLPVLLKANVNPTAPKYFLPPLPHSVCRWSDLRRSLFYSLVDKSKMKGIDVRNHIPIPFCPNIFFKNVFQKFISE